QAFRISFHQRGRDDLEGSPQRQPGSFAHRRRLMKSFGKAVSRLLSWIIVALLLLGLVLPFGSKPVKAQSSTLADLYLDLPFNYRMEAFKPKFNLEDYQLFEKVFLHASLFENRYILKRSYFANYSKSFTLIDKRSND